jgi:hypothetical protein
MPPPQPGKAAAMLIIDRDAPAQVSLVRTGGLYWYDEAPPVHAGGFFLSVSIIQPALK